MNNDTFKKCYMIDRVVFDDNSPYEDQLKVNVYDDNQNWILEMNFQWKNGWNLMSNVEILNIDNGEGLQIVKELYGQSHFKNIRFSEFVEWMGNLGYSFKGFDYETCQSYLMTEENISELTDMPFYH